MLEIFLAEFNMSERAMISDPCKPRDAFGIMGKVRVHPGLWLGTFLRKSNALLCFHDDRDFPNTTWDGKDEEVMLMLLEEWSQIGDIWIDSRQAGVFCETIYPHDDSPSHTTELDSFYRQCRKNTDELKEHGFQTFRCKDDVERGIVTAARWRKAWYGVHSQRNEYGVTDAILIDFGGAIESELCPVNYCYSTI